MYHCPTRRGGVHNVAGTRSRKVPVGAHEGSRADYLRRIRCQGAEAARHGGPARNQYLADLLDRLADTRSLLSAAARVRTLGGPAAGSDGVSPADLDARTVGALAREIRRLVLAGVYRPGRYRRVPIPKPGGRGTRVLSVPTVADRILQTAALISLQAYLDYLLPEEVIGSRPGRSAHHALALLSRRACSRPGALVAADLRKAFDHVPRHRLMDVLGYYLRDARTLALLEAVVGDTRGRGIPQGGPLSPLLLNIYLHHTLDTPLRRRHPRVLLIRYVDDVLLVCQDRTEADAAARTLERLAASAGLPLKVQTTAGGETGRCLMAETGRGERVEWLGYTVGITPDGRLDLRVANKAWDALEAGLADAHRHPTPAAQAETVTRGWLDYLGACLPSVTGKFYARLRRVLARHGFQELYDREWAQGALEAGHARYQRCLAGQPPDGTPRARTRQPAASAERMDPPPAPPPTREGGQDGKAGPTTMTGLPKAGPTAPPVTPRFSLAATPPGRSPGGVGGRPATPSPPSLPTGRRTPDTPPAGAVRATGLTLRRSRSDLPTHCTRRPTPPRALRRATPSWPSVRTGRSARPPPPPGDARTPVPGSHPPPWCGDTPAQ